MVSLEYTGGLFDGEGNFRIQISRVARSKGRTPTGLTLQPRMSIDMSHANDIFRMIQSRFGGNIYPTKRKPYIQTFIIAGIAPCLSFATAILPHLRVKKKQCEVFLEIIHKMKEEGIHYTKEGIIWIAKRSRDLTFFPQARKWTPEYLEVFFSNYSDIDGKRRDYQWTLKEVQILKENRDKTAKELHKTLLARHTIEAIKQKRKRSGIKADLKKIQKRLARNRHLSKRSR